MRTFHLKRIPAMTAALLLAATSGTGASPPWLDTSIIEEIRSDYARLYSPNNIPYLSDAIALSGFLANSPVDRRLQSLYHSEYASDMPGAFKTLGEGSVVIPLSAAAFLAGMYFEGNGSMGIIGDWGRLTLRGFAGGAPALLTMQRVTGAGRPGIYGTGDSNWRPFEAAAGASGHSFMGAVPFMVAARMTDGIAFKGLFYAASGLCALSRINDNAHFPSQAGLGLWLAYKATHPSYSKPAERRVHFYPTAMEDGIGVMALYRF